MLIFAIDWCFLTILLIICAFYLLPKYLLYLISKELGKLNISKLLKHIKQISGYEFADSSLSVFLQQFITKHIDTLLKEKFIFLANFIPNSLKEELAFQVSDSLSKQILGLFVGSYLDKVNWLRLKLRGPIYGFFQSHRLQIIVCASIGGFIGGIIHICSVMLAQLIYN